MVDDQDFAMSDEDSQDTHEALKQLKEEYNNGEVLLGVSFKNLGIFNTHVATTLGTFPIHIMPGRIIFWLS